MNCLEFENAVVDMACEELPQATNREALAHAGTCARCARRLANEQVLSGVISAAVAEDAAREAPPVVGKMLLTAFRERQEALRQRQRAWLVRAITTGAIAATLLVAAAVALRKPEGSRTAPVNAAPLPLAPKAAASVSSMSRESRKPEADALSTAAENDAESDEVMTDFIPVVYDPEPIERGRLVRVQLPRAALLAFGLPVNEDRTEDFVQAECLLDQDGLMRAVRFVE